MNQTLFDIIFLKIEEEAVAELTKLSGNMRKVIKLGELKKATSCNCRRGTCEEVTYCVRFQQKGSSQNGVLRVDLVYRGNGRGRRRRRKQKQREMINLSVDQWQQEEVEMKGTCSNSQVS